MIAELDIAHSMLVQYQRTKPAAADLMETALAIYIHHINLEMAVGCTEPSPLLLLASLKTGTLLSSDLICLTVRELLLFQDEDIQKLKSENAQLRADIQNMAREIDLAGDGTELL